MNPVEHRERPTDQTARYTRRTEHLLTLLLAAKADFGFGYFAGLARGGKRYDHDYAGSYKEIDGSIGRSVERTHQKTGCVSSSVGDIVLI